MTAEKKVPAEQTHRLLSVKWLGVSSPTHPQIATATLFVFKWSNKNKKMTDAGVEPAIS